MYSPQHALISGLHGLKEKLCRVLPEQSSPVLRAVQHERPQALQAGHLQSTVSGEEHLGQWQEGTSGGNDGTP